jgi:tetratricopeptide (TPR) repeat protein
VALSERLFGPESTETAVKLDHMAVAEHRAEHDQDALVHDRRALAITERAYGPLHPDTAAVLNNMANALRALGRLDEALETYGRSYAAKVAAEGAATATSATTLANIGIVLAVQGKFAEALDDELRALEVRRRVLGNDHPDVAMTLENSSEMLLHLGRWGEARSFAEEALSIRTRMGGVDSLYRIAPLVDLALAQLGERDAAGATQNAERALLLAESGHAGLEDMAVARFGVAVVRGTTGTQRDRARALAAAARATLAKKPALYRDMVARLDALFPGFPASPPVEGPRP